MLSYKIIRFNGEKSNRIRSYQKNFTNNRSISRYYSEGGGGGLSKAVSKRAEIFVNNLYRLPIFRNESRMIFTIRDFNILLDIAVDMFEHDLEIGLEKIRGNHAEMLKVINEVSNMTGGEVEEESEMTEEEADVFVDENLDLKEDEKADYISVYESAMILARYMFTFLFNTSLSTIMSRVVINRYKKPLNIVLANAGSNTKRNLFKLFFVTIRKIMNTSGLNRYKKIIQKNYPNIFRNELQEMARVLAAQAISTIVTDYGEFRNVTGISVAKYATAMNDYTKLIDFIIKMKCMRRLQRLALAGSSRTPSEMSDVEFARDFNRIRPGRRAYRIADRLLRSKGPRYFSRPERVTESLLRLFSSYFSEEELEQIEDEVNVTIKRAEAQELVSNLRDLVAKLSELLLGETEITERYTIDTGEEEVEEDTEGEDTEDEDTEEGEDTEEEGEEEGEDTEEEEGEEEGEDTEEEEEGEEEEGEEEGKYRRFRRWYSDDEDDEEYDDEEEEEDEEDDYGEEEEEEEDDEEEGKYRRFRRLFSKRTKSKKGSVLKRKTRRDVRGRSLERPANFFEIDKTDKFLRRLGLPKKPKK